MITLKDIAKESGYSVSAVSKALNNADDITLETKQKIQQLAQRMGYVRNENAASLSRKNKKNSIAIIARTNEDYNYIDEITSKISISSTLAAHKLELDAITIYDDILMSLSEIEIINYLKQKNIKGLVLFGVDRPEHKINTLIASDEFKVVSIDMPFTNNTTSAVTIDNRRAQRDIITELHKEHNFKNILYIAGHPHSSVSTERLLGVNDFTHDNIDVTVIKEFGLFSKRRAVSIVKQADIRNIDAIICANDLMAVAVKNYLISINEDKLVAGFDGLRLLDLMPYKIPTVKQDHVSMGYKAVKELNKLLTDPNHNGQVIYDDYFIKL